MPLGIVSKFTMSFMYQNPHCWGKMAPSIKIDLSKNVVEMKIPNTALMSTEIN